MKVILFINLLIAGILFGQETDSISLKYIEAINTYDSFNYPIDNIEKLKLALPAFEKSYKKLLEIDDFSNVKLQKIITSDFRSDYGEMFLRKENKKTYYVFPSSFNTKSDVLDFLSIGKELIQVKTLIEINKVIHEGLKKYKLDNLKRIGMSEKDFDSLSDKDKELIYQQFE